MPNLLKIFLIFSITAFGSSALSGDLEDGMRAAEIKDFSKALELWTPLAEQGDNEAQFNIGHLYLKGNGVTRNFTIAAKWLEMAAVRGHRQAQFDIGTMYRFGEGVPQNYNIAAKWLEMAAKQNLPSAQLQLGFLYDSGQGVAKDYFFAAYWFEKAAEQGDPTAQYLIGLSYSYARGVNRDYKLALKWFSLAAEQGKISSQGELGKIYAEGLGVPRDNFKAYIWLNIAAVEGDPKILKARDLLKESMTTAELAAAEDASNKCIKQKFKNCDKLIISSNLTAEDEMRDDAAKAIEIFDRDFKQTGMTGIQVSTIPDCYKKIRKGSTYRAVRLCCMIDLWAVFLDGQMSEMMKWPRNEYLTPNKYVERIRKAKAHLSAVDVANMGENWIEYLNNASKSKQ